jgi:uncharacterized protein
VIDRACISLGEQCNLRCNYCHFGDRLTGSIQEFSHEELCSLIDEIHSYCTSNTVEQFKIGIVGAGEPLLQYDKVRSLMNYVKNIGSDIFSFYTITNGTLFTEQMAEYFHENRHLITVCFSLDGYEEIHNVGREKFEESYGGIKRYERIFSKKPAVNCTVHQMTVENADAVRHFFSKEDFTDVTFSRLVDSTDEKLSISKSEYDEFIDGCVGFPFSVRQLKNENSKKYDCTMYGKLCGVGKTNIFITRLGIYPCGRFYGNDKYNFGPFDSKLKNVELKMAELERVGSGECYFDKYVEI